MFGVQGRPGFEVINLGVITIWKEMKAMEIEETDLGEYVGSED